MWTTPTARPASTTNSTVRLSELSISSVSLASWSGRTDVRPARHHVLDAGFEQVGTHVTAQVAVGDDADETA